MSVTAAVAVKKFFEKDSKHGKITTSEFFGFWKSLSVNERKEFAEASAEELGETLEAKKV